MPNNPVNAPVVLIFHGHGSSNDSILGLGGEVAPYKIWLDIAARENIILAVPNGLFVSDNEKGWNDCRTDAPTNSRADDVGFIDLLIGHLTSTYGANSNKVYANGTSNGGHFSIRLAQDLPQKITAFAAIISANAVNSECSTSAIPVSALFMNGTADPILPYNGGQMASNRGQVFSTESTVAYWANRNGTEAGPAIFDFPNTNTGDNSTVRRFTYTNGSNNTEVVLYRVSGGGHTDPSKIERYSGPVTTILGNQNADIEMAEEV